MKYVTLFVVLGSIASIIYGFSIQEEALPLANKYIGFGTLGLFLVAMPLFLITHSKGKKMSDYMLTDENLKKMRARERKKSE